MQAATINARPSACVKAFRDDTLVRTSPLFVDAGRGRGPCPFEFRSPYLPTSATTPGKSLTSPIFFKSNSVSGPWRVAYHLPLRFLLRVDRFFRIGSAATTR